MTKIQKAVAAALCGFAVFASPVSALADCRTLSFSVNDYGKEGPAKDAAELLDKYIVRWTKEKGIKKYKKVPKDIKCELFLDVVLFDEYTCTAAADICW
jgi:hypothetical protein